MLLSRTLIELVELILVRQSCCVSSEVLGELDLVKSHLFKHFCLVSKLNERHLDLLFMFGMSGLGLLLLVGFSLLENSIGLLESELDVFSNSEPIELLVNFHIKLVILSSNECQTGSQDNLESHYII